MSRSRPILCLLLVAMIISACVSLPTDQPAKPGPATLSVFAAASLSNAFNELGKEFEAQHPGAKVEFNYAGSQQLSQQLAQGASADVFASANSKQMDAAVTAGRVAEGGAQPFAHNRLVVIYPAGGKALTTLSDLAQPGLHVVLAAKEVPVGQYSLDFLDKAAADPELGAAFRDGVLANVVSYEENVKAVLAKVSLGEADAGIVYTSDLAGSGADKVGRLDIPDALNVIATYPIAIISDSAHGLDAADFIELVLSDQGQAVLAKYGLLPVK
jgi:molybdate transport system substrate-binding protein